MFVGIARRDALGNRRAVLAPFRGEGNAADRFAQIAAMPRAAALARKFRRSIFRSRCGLQFHNRQWFKTGLTLAVAKIASKAIRDERLIAGMKNGPIARRNP